MNAHRVTQRCTLLCPTADLTFFEHCLAGTARQHSQPSMPGHGTLFASLYGPGTAGGEIGWVAILPQPWAACDS